MAFQKGHKINNGRIFTKEHKTKIGTANSISLKGRKLSEETKKRMKQNNSKYWLGKKRPTGEDSCHWKGGVTKENERLRCCVEYNLWREAVLKRDNYTCIWCGLYDKSNHADHIKPFGLYPELRFAIDNGRTLCEKCHRTTYKDYFKDERYK